MRVLRNGTYRDETRATVKKYNGSYWQYVGDRGFSEGYSVDRFQISVIKGTPYIYYYDTGASWRNKMQKFDGNDWIQAGDLPLNTATIQKLKENNNILYALVNTSGSYSVQRLINESWEQMGGIIEPNIQYKDMEIINGIVYISYNTSNKKPEIIQFAPTE